MAHPRPAVHRTIVVVDVERFGDLRRTNPHQVVVRDGVWHALKRAFGDAGIQWARCHREDRGDGALILAQAHVPKGRFVESLPGALAAALHEHNCGRCAEERIRLRLAVHAGEVCHDAHGVAGTAVNVAFRLLGAEPLRRALASSSGVLAVIASQWFFEEVIRHTPASSPASYRQVQVSVKETSTTAWVCLPDDPYPPETGAPPALASAVTVPRQLPAAVAGFAGRAAELEVLTSLLEKSAAAGTVVISAVGGTAGIGKTALAVHWAHQVRDRFPDGQLYVNLRGFDPGGQVMCPAEAVRRFLDALDVEPQRIPADLEAQAALYRSLLAGKRLLIVLDNARDTAQVRPLLPGTPGCPVVVTSRNQLTGLVAADGAYPVSLELLTREEARELLGRRLGPDRIAAEPQPVEEIITRCARLPLALAIVAARAATHRHLPLHGLATQLRDGARLDTLTTDDPHIDVRAAFSWSYRALSTDAARLLRLLGQHPGPDISTPAAASLAALPLPQVQPLLAELTRANLLVEPTPGRYTFHDLLRAYATEQAHTTEPSQQRHAATHRILDHYLHTANTAALLLNPTRDPITLTPPQPGVTPEHTADHQQALTWFTTEHAVLLAAVDHAAAAGFDAHTWQLAWTLADFLDRAGHWHDWAATQQVGLAAARRLTDSLAQARAHRLLARAYTQLGRYDDAQTHYQQALELYRHASDQVGQAQTHHSLAWLSDQQGHHAEALHRARQALDLYRAAGHSRGEADALNSVGWYHAMLGDHQQALIHCEQALTLLQKLGYRPGEADTWDSVGYAHHHLGHHTQALNCYQHAVNLYRDLGDHYGEADVLTHLGDTHHATSNSQAARDAWQQALTILNDLDHPDADQVRARLAALEAPTGGTRGGPSR